MQAWCAAAGGRSGRRRTNLLVYWGLGIPLAVWLAFRLQAGVFGLWGALVIITVVQVPGPPACCPRHLLEQARSHRCDCIPHTRDIHTCVLRLKAFQTAFCPALLGSHTVVRRKAVHERFVDSRQAGPPALPERHPGW